GNRATRGDAEVALPCTACGTHRSRYYGAAESVRTITRRLQRRTHRHPRRNTNAREGPRLSECHSRGSGFSRRGFGTTRLSICGAYVSTHYAGGGTRWPRRSARKSSDSNVSSLSLCLTARVCAGLRRVL